MIELNLSLKWMNLIYPMNLMYKWMGMMKTRKRRMMMDMNSY
jgi:hypothetical protein